MVATAVFEPPDELLDKEVRRLQIGQVLIDGVSFPEQIRPGSDLLVQVHGFGPNPDLLSLQLVPAEGDVSALSDLERGEIQRADSFTRVERIIMDVAPGMYLLVGEYGGPPAGGRSAVCSWLARPTTGCVLGEVEVSGAPLPEGAINFEDKIALLAVDVPDMALQPGGQLA
ncbi:MAG: hypothetical protein GWN30_38475, partial [Gammaproteobacteria bacterium]|nr:hypothetical protein [Gammaproteobacteria bacterium]